jgi:hypothetical protein
MPASGVSDHGPAEGKTPAVPQSLTFQRTDSHHPRGKEYAPLFNGQNFVDFSPTLYTCIEMMVGLTEKSPR